MTIKKTASAEWSGGLKDGTGYISTETKALERHPYGFKARFEEGPGTNPEELIGAAHAGCFTMFLSGKLADTGMMALKRQARDLDYKVDVKSPSNAKYSGTFTRNGKNYELRGCCIYQKSNPSRVWSVITVYPKDSSDGKEASERIINSAMFKGSSEECK